MLALLFLSGCSLLQGSSPKAQPNTPLAGVEILSRAEWNAAEPVMEMRPQTPQALTIHHTAVMQKPELSPEAKVQALQRFSISSDTLDDGRPKLPWADVPYHFYIANDGTVVEARDVNYEGDTNTGYDLHGQIQIVVEGNFMVEEPTAAQMASLRALAAALAVRYDISSEHVEGHRDRKGKIETSCPGDALRSRFPEVLAAMDAARAAN